MLKSLEFRGSSKADLCDLRPGLQKDIGFQLFRIQEGKEPSDFKPMTSIGSGVFEIRVRDDDGIARAFYVTKFGNRIFVLHVFLKKSPKTSRRDLEIGHKRDLELKKELER